MTSEVEVLRAALKQHFESNATLDMEVMKREVLLWYRINRDRAFAPPAADAPRAARLADTMFQSLGHIRTSHQKVQMAQEQKETKSCNVNVAVDRAVKNALTGRPQAGHEEARASVVARLTGWMNEQLKGVFADLANAQAQMAKAEQAVEGDIKALVDVLHAEYEQAKTTTWDTDEIVRKMMADVEMQLQSLDLGNAKPEAETGGTGNKLAESKASTGYLFS